MIGILFLLALLNPVHAQNPPLVVAVLDSGLNLSDPRFKNILCKKSQHVDLTGESITDYNGHGTHIVGIIKDFAGKSNYCIMVIKYWTINHSDEENGQDSITGIKWAISHGANIVNISGGGEGDVGEDCKLIAKNKQITWFLAAGNDSRDVKSNYYPASCKNVGNIHVVGSLNQSGLISSTSNFGNKVTDWEIGVDVLSTLPHDQTGYKSGTSQATAIATGKYIHERVK